MKVLKVGQVWSAPDRITVNGSPVTRTVGVRVIGIDPVRREARLVLVKDPRYAALVWLPLEIADWTLIANWTLIEDVP